jgi:catechol 2,3-dioxygenase-like lactoylglutathione lyase family enzyme
MSECEALGEKERKKRRTIADAIDALQKNAGFDGDDRGQIQLGRIRLPSRQVVSLTWVSFESATHQKTFIVKLPTATRFKATSQGQLLIGDIGLLEGASLDEKGNVELQDGTLIRAVEIVPAPLPYNISDLDSAIVAVTVLKLEGSPFTSFRAGTSYLNLIAQPAERRSSWWGRVIFYVADVDALYDRALAAGYQPATAPRDAEWGERFLHLNDPDGHELSFARPLFPVSVQ